MDVKEIICPNIQTFPSGYTYKVISSEPDLQRILIKEVEDEASAKVWKEKYEETNVFSWRVLETFPHSGKVNLYKIRYRCQHFVPKQKVLVAPKRIVSSRNTRCPATMTVSIKRFTKKSRSKNSIYELYKDYRCEVTLFHTHNHDTHATSRNHRLMSDSYREKILNMFVNGHTPASAHNTLLWELYNEKDDEQFLYSADGQYTPCLNQVQYLYNKRFGDIYGKKTQNVQDDIQSYISNYTNNSGEGKIKYTYVLGHNIVAICSPLMTRVHKYIRQSSELVLLDAIKCMDEQNSRMYLFMTTTPAGPLPIGAILTDVESKPVFEHGLKELISCFPDKLAFFGKAYPSVILTDDDLEERIPLKHFFPDTHLLLSQSHTLKTVWIWIFSSKNKIPCNKRLELYLYFKDMLNEKDINVLYSRYEEFLQKCEFDSYKSYITNEKWTRKEEWALAYRLNMTARGNNPTDYVDISFRLMKDIILHRVKNYDMEQLLDFILVKLETYYRKRCIDYANGRYNEALLKKFLPVETQISANAVKQISETMFLVQSDTKKSYYFVCMESCACSCPIAITGKFCKHLPLVLSQTSIDESLFMLSENTKGILSKIGGQNIKLQNETIVDISQEEESTYSPPTVYAIKSEESHDTQSPKLLPEVLDTLDQYLKRIKFGIIRNPTVFIPAANQMAANINGMIQTDSDLISSMQTLGKGSSSEREKDRRVKKKLATSIMKPKYKNRELRPTQLKVSLTECTNNVLRPILPKILVRPA